MSELPAWPELTGGKTVGAHYAEDLDITYERARANAWEARCRVAVEALQLMYDNAPSMDGRCVDTVRRALTAIGPLPPATPASTEQKERG